MKKNSSLAFKIFLQHRRSYLLNYQSWEELWSVSFYHLSRRMQNLCQPAAKFLDNKAFKRQTKVSMWAQNETKAVFNLCSQIKILVPEDPRESVMLNITTTLLSRCLALSSVHLTIGISGLRSWIRRTRENPCACELLCGSVNISDGCDDVFSDTPSFNGVSLGRGDLEVVVIWWLGGILFRGCSPEIWQ